MERLSGHNSKYVLMRRQMPTRPRGSKIRNRIITDPKTIIWRGISTWDWSRGPASKSSNSHVMIKGMVAMNVAPRNDPRIEP